MVAFRLRTGSENANVGAILEPVPARGLRRQANLRCVIAGRHFQNDGLGSEPGGAGCKRNRTGRSSIGSGCGRGHGRGSEGGAAFVHMGQAGILAAGNQRYQGKSGRNGRIRNSPSSGNGTNSTRGTESHAVQLRGRPWLSRALWGGTCKSHRRLCAPPEFPCSPHNRTPPSPPAARCPS